MSESQDEISDCANASSEEAKMEVNVRNLQQFLYLEMKRQAGHIPTFSPPHTL